MTWCSMSRLKNKSGNAGSEGVIGNDTLEDKHTFRMSLLKFAALNGEAQRELSSLLRRALEGTMMR